MTLPAIQKVSATAGAPGKKEKEMLPRRMLVVFIVGVCTAGMSVAETVGVSGSDTKYEASMEAAIGGQQVKMVLTGTALRKKFIFHVYAIGSYVQEGSGVHGAEELAAVDCPKQLHLVMERDVDGKAMAEAFQSAIRLNYPEPTFNDEVNALTGWLRNNPVKEGDHIQ